jgi:hypothetical protein
LQCELSNFNKRLDYKDKKYLLNPTQFGEINYYNISDLDLVVQFFKKKLGTNVTLKKDFKDNNKLQLPFRINYDPANENILTLLKYKSKLYCLGKILYL